MIFFKKLIAIAGPTASGKSELAVFLAQKIKKQKLGGFKCAEIISADSRQVYKFLDVGTNKIPGKWQVFNDSTAKDIVFMYKGIRHYCIDFVHPQKTFTVADFKKCADKAIAEIEKRGHIPILAGGTGFYIDAVLYDTAIPDVPPNKKLRSLLEKKSTEQLFSMLKKLDPKRAMHIDPHNPRRLIRAIEIVKSTKKPVPAFSQTARYDALIIGLNPSNNALKKTLEKRSKKQIPGLLKEIQLLFKMKISKKRIHELGFEYKIALKYFGSFGSPTSIFRKLDFRNMEEELIKENWRYAKRQMTWFKRDKRIKWIINKTDACNQIKKFLNSPRPRQV